MPASHIKCSKHEFLTPPRAVADGTIRRGQRTQSSSPHAADARLNLAGLLNALGRRRAAAALLRAAPPGSLDGEEDAADAARLLEEATA